MYEYASKDGRGPVVIVVEDEFLICEMIAEALEEAGYRVHCAGAAREALELLAGQGAAADLLFTDINLPGGVDGETLARQARLIRPDLKIVYASGRWQSLDAQRAVPGSAFIAKPYSPWQVTEVVHDMLVGKMK